jgi:hypothetical protein
MTSAGPLGKRVETLRATSLPSYLVNYRYSTFALVGDLFPDMAGEVAGARYQDLTVKLNFPTRKAGTFTVWGIAIKDHFAEREPKDTVDWYNYHAEFAELVGNEADFWQTKVVGGMGHRILVGEKAYLKSAVVANYTQNKTTGDIIYPRHNWERFPVMNMHNTNWNVAFNTYLNTKFSASHTNRTGVNVAMLFFDMDYSMYPNIYDIPEYPLPGAMVHFTDDNGGSTAVSAYSQSSFRLNSRLTANVGLHAAYFRLNGNTSIEPRAAIRWQALPKHAFGLAYGKHSRRENTDYYFIKTPATGDELVNQNLDFAKAHHIVFSYDWSISEHARIKVEPYFQYLYDVPVENGSHLSIINYYDFLTMLPALVNDGKGRNYGIDMTMERYLHHGYYYLLTATLFDSRYRDGNGVWRNTRLNRNYIFNALGGKEWKMGKQKQNILSASLRFTAQGGERYIPVHEANSIAARNIVYDNARAYEQQYPLDFLCHFNIGFKINRNKLSHEFAFQMMNLTGSKEYYWEYNYRLEKPERIGGTGGIPNLYYKIEF